MPPTCVRCDSPATVHLTKVVNGKAAEFHFCADCAPPLLTGKLNAEKEVAKLFKAIEPLAAGVLLRRAGEPTVPCPECGITFVQFKQVGRFGCAHDYQAFGSHVEALLGSIHKATRYTGKAPGGGSQIRNGVLVDAAMLAGERLKAAVEREDYEEAARIRDEIRKLGALGGPLP